jgi:hypothetical protein
MMQSDGTSCTTGTRTRLVQELLASQPFVAIGVSFPRRVRRKGVMTGPHDEGRPIPNRSEKLGRAFREFRISVERPPSDAPIRRR